MPNSKWVVNIRPTRDGTPKYDAYVGRPSPFGNPFSHEKGTLAKYKVKTREEAIARFREFLMRNPNLLRLVKKHLRGKILGCWCAPLPCHAEVLAEVANGPV
jgi:hypothetical protein